MRSREAFCTYLHSRQASTQSNLGEYLPTTKTGKTSPDQLGCVVVALHFLFSGALLFQVRLYRHQDNLPPFGHEVPLFL